MGVEFLSFDDGCNFGFVCFKVCVWKNRERMGAVLPKIEPAEKEEEEEEN